MKRFGIFGLLLMLIVIFFIPNDNVHAEENDECSFEMSELVELDANVDENTRYMNTVSDYNTGLWEFISNKKIIPTDVLMVDIT